LVVATVVAFAIVGTPSSASAQGTAGSATIVDAVGDAGGAPDITAVAVANDDSGSLSFRIVVSNRTELVAGETAVIFINSDERRDTGTPELFGADVQFVLNGDGSFLMRRWDESSLSFPLAPSPSASLTAGWSDGYRFSIALSELKSPRRIEFAAGTRTAAGGAVAKDQLNGRYDTQTGEGVAFDPFLDIPPATSPPAASKPPAAPQTVGASRARRDGVRISWATSAGALKYELWRSATPRGLGLRVGTTTATTFVDKRAARGVLYYYAARAGNTTGWSPFSHKVRGGRR
jgi:hypothetical protein